VAIRFIRVALLFCLPFFFLACASTPAPEQEHYAVAMRFIRSLGVGDFAMLSMQNELKNQAQYGPGMKELMEKLFSSISKQDFEELAGRVYMQHLSQDELTELLKFSESPTGSRFFKAIFNERLENGSKADNQSLMSRFKADELAQIMKFALSDSFLAMKRELPQINKELAESGRELGRQRFKAYLEQL
jgi:hypothetical protein